MNGHVVDTACLAVFLLLSLNFHDLLQAQNHVSCVQHNY